MEKTIEDYKKEYKPAYRVIPKIYADYWDIIKKIYHFQSAICFMPWLQTVNDVTNK